MIGAAIADTHLGFIGLSATEGGRNQRELDVERAFAFAIDQIVAAQPDLLTVAGDVMHSPRVSMYAVKAWREGVRRIVEQTEAHVVVVLGNHDVGRTISTLTPVILPDDYPRVHIVSHPCRVRFTARSGEAVSVACFPFVVMAQDESVYRLEPDPMAQVNILLVHAAVRGSTDELPHFYGGPHSLDLGREADRFDAIACGDWHEFQRLHPSRTAFYSGSLERTSSDIWKEKGPKGWVLYDTVAKTMEFKDVPTRPMYDYDMGVPNPGQAVDVSAVSVNAYLSKLVEAPHLPGAIVRFKVDDFPKDQKDLIDRDLVRQLQATCLHFQLDVSYAKAEAPGLGDRRDREGGVMSIEREARAFFAEDEGGVRELAFRFLEIDGDVPV